MLVEDVVLGGLKAGPSWFVSDYLLRGDSQSDNTDVLAQQIADRNDLRCERTRVSGVDGYRFWRIERALKIPGFQSE